MKNRKANQRQTSWIIGFIAAYSIMPIISRIISTFFTTYAFMFFLLLFLIIILCSNHMQRFDPCISVLLPFGFFEFLTFFNKSNSLLLWGYQVLLFLLPILLGYYLQIYQPDTMKTIGVVVSVALILTVITTIIGLQQYPEAARQLATIGSTSDSRMIVYNWHNIGGFGFVYTIALLYPIVILAYKKKRFNRIWMIVITVAFFFLIVSSEYTIALLLFLTSSLLYFAGKKLRPYQVLLMGMGMILFLLLFQPLFSKGLLWLSDQLGSETLGARLTALAGGREGLESSDDQRLLLYQRSLATFFHYPIGGLLLFGSGMVSGHSFLLDSLAQYGLLGGVTLFFMYRKIYNIFFRPYQNQEGFGFIIWIFAQAIVLSLLNPGMWEFVLCLYVPCLLRLLYEQDSESEFVREMK